MTRERNRAVSRDEPWNRQRLRRAAAHVLQSGLSAVDPRRLVRETLRLDGSTLEIGVERHALGRGRLLLVAIGKAASSMADAASGILGRRLEAGLVVDTSSHIPLSGLVRLLAGHPIPDARGISAAREVEKIARSLGPRDVLLVLVSGGASALLPAPVDGVSLADKAAVTSLLLRAGAEIHELNVVRKHLSRLKGGGLARAAAPARVICMALSDVVGDDLPTIASGLTVPDPSTFAQAVEVMQRYRVWDHAPPTVRSHLEAGRAGSVFETLKPGDPFFKKKVTTRVIGGNRHALQSSARAARKLGLRTLVLTSRLKGEAREVARVLTAILRECIETGNPLAPPVCLLAGGETTVTVRGEGRGGRNQELVTAASGALAAFPSHAVVASMGTDGVDGASEAAGGVVDQETIRRAKAIGLAPVQQFLNDNDSNSFLAPLGDLIITGPTGTNVCDLVVLLAGGRIATPRIE